VSLRPPYLKVVGIVLDSATTNHMEQPMQAWWTPTPFNLLGGNPFPYSEHDISVISATEAFETAIDCRDKERCVVCGDDLSIEHAHIIPKTEPRTVSHSHYLFSRILSSHTVERDAQTRLHPSPSKICSPRATERYVVVWKSSLDV